MKALLAAMSLMGLSLADNVDMFSSTSDMALLARQEKQIVQRLMQHRQFLQREIDMVKQGLMRVEEGENAANLTGAEWPDVAELTKDLPPFEELVGAANG